MRAINKIAKKVMIVGDAQCGKTAYIRRLRSSEFKADYEPTMGVEVTPVVVRDDDGKSYVYNMWDCAGNERFAGLGDGYYIGADAFLVFFDFSREESYRNALILKERIVDDYPNAHVFIIGNKIDLFAKRINRLPNFHEDVCISARSLYNWEEPLKKLGLAFFGKRTTTYDN